MPKTIFAFIAGAALMTAPVLADDSSAALSAGGIVFTSNTPVRMAVEDLYVSPTAVRIRFEFVNDTANDVDTIVAFPLPDIDTAEFWGSGIGTVTADPVNFMGFKAVVDGKPVAFTMEQRAFLKDQDVTSLVASAGLQINPAAGDGYNKLETLSADARKRLIAAGVAQGDVNEFVPQWTVRTKFYWPQHFPAHKTVVIEHSYQPVTGQSFFNKDDLTNKWEAQFVRASCIDPPTKAKIVAMSEARRKANPDTSGYLNAYHTDYILKTANNWNGPIGKFHLTLDKLKPENVLSLCWDGALKRTGPTTFEAVRTNFAPARDIHLLVLE